MSDTAIRYSHRNGESDAPTIFNQWYWFYSEDDAGIFAEGVFYIDPDGWLQNTLNPTGESDAYSLNDLQGRWWGPVTPPWQS